MLDQGKGSQSKRSYPISERISRRNKLKTNIKHAPKCDQLATVLNKSRVYKEKQSKVIIFRSLF